MPEEHIEINFDDEPRERPSDRLVISTDDLTVEEPARPASPPWQPAQPAPTPWEPAGAAPPAWGQAPPARAPWRTVLLVVAIAMPVLLAVAGGLYWQCLGRPSAVVRSFSQAMHRKDWQGAAGYFSRDTLTALDDSRKQFIPILRLGGALFGNLPGQLTGLTPEKLEKMGPKEFFGVVMDLMDATGQNNIPALTVSATREQIDGATATVIVTDAAGATVPVTLVREGVFWKIDMAGMLQTPSW